MEVEENTEKPCELLDQAEQICLADEWRQPEYLSWAVLGQFSNGAGGAGARLGVCQAGRQFRPQLHIKTHIDFGYPARD